MVIFAGIMLTAIQIIFFIGLFILFYSYLGYGILLYILIKVRGMFSKKTVAPPGTWPAVTLIVAAYNEQDFIEQKITNSLSLDYPRGALEILFVTDGSSDNTPSIVARFPSIKLLHNRERKGKVDAMHRAMQFVQTPFVIFSDANTLLNRESIKNIIRHYSDPRIGGVAGEKKIIQSFSEAAAGAGEGLYWKYESTLKKLDYQFYSVVGAAGELFSLRTALYEYPGPDVLLDDLIISLRICMKGYRFAYEPAAYAMESASVSLKEEKKRKIRISAGAFQSMKMLSGLLNVFKYPRLSFQYISHRVLRWTLCPLFLPLVLLCNILLVMYSTGWVYSGLLLAQVLFYFLAFLGYLMKSRKTRIGFLYAPYYFLFINYSLYGGFVRHLKGRQTVLWEKASREVYPDKFGDHGS